MRKYIFSTFCVLLVNSSFLSAQPVLTTEDVMPVKNMSKRGNVVKEDKISVSEVTGVGSSSFSTSNIYDGTVNSYKHSLKITMALLTSGTPKENFQLVFYSPEDKIAYVANSDAGTTYVYYPVSLYDAIKQKLDQSFANKKRVQIKVTQKTDGFREAILIL